jgi:hypothetical protein
VGGAIALSRVSSSDGSEKRKGELGMSSWMNSGFSEPITMVSGFWDPEARGLQIQLIRGCTMGLANFQNLVPMPRNIREATKIRIKVPAPAVIIMALMMNYRRGYSTMGCRRLTKNRFKTRLQLV